MQVRGVSTISGVHSPTTKTIFIAVLLLSISFQPANAVASTTRRFTASTHGEIIYPTNNIFGVMVWTGASDVRIDYTEELGVGWARCGHAGSWRFIEPQQGEYDWVRPDKLVDEMRIRGIEPLIIAWGAPYWASGTNDSGAPPTDISLYKVFVKKLVSRYDLKVVELGNEPKYFFSGTYDQYVALIRAGYEGAKEANPNCIVIGGWGGGGIWSNDQPYGTWGIGHLVDRGFLNYVDALSIHPYTASTPPEDVIPSQLRELRNYLEDNGQGSLPLYATEFGYGLATGWPGGGHTLESQADFTIRAANILYNDPYVKMIVYFTLYSSHEFEMLDLLEPSTGNPRPVYYAYKDFISTHI